MNPARALPRELEDELQEFFETPPIDEWHEATRHSRARRLCTECMATIERGEAYQRINAFTDHRWVTVSRCRACAALAARLGERGIEPNQLNLVNAIYLARRAGHHDLPTPQDHRRLWEASAPQTVQEGPS